MATYIDSFANLAGPLLGLSMSLSALLSGEMKDTANLGPLEPWPGGGATVPGWWLQPLILHA